MSASARAFLCECGGRSCRAEPRLTEAQYAELRMAGLKVIAAVHEVPAGIVVERGPGWYAVGRRRKRLEVAESQPMVEAGYCPTCKEETIPSGRGRCLWCGTLLAPVEAAA